ncbi:MAG: CHAT domain-containing protein [Acidobacteria bacterium]|nr:CHAT domain-containing protein [Acidobacteriota bacterium]
MSTPNDSYEMLNIEIEKDGSVTLSGANIANKSCQQAANPLPSWAGLDDKEAGEALYNWLFQGKLRDFWRTAFDKNPKRRVRLSIFEDAPHFHLAPWELLRKPETEQGLPFNVLAADSDTPFSRTIPQLGFSEIEVDEGPVRVLVAIAAPGDQPQFDPAVELRAIEEAVKKYSGVVGVVPRPCSLTAIEQELDRAMVEKQPYHILHLIAHGRFVPQEDAPTAELYLEKASSEAAQGYETDYEVTDRDFARMISSCDGGKALRLAVLCSCQSAARSGEDAFQGLGLQLVKADMPAVVAMRDIVALDTARDFSVRFYKELLTSGVVDRACNIARASLVNKKDSGSGIPTLFMRVADGRLFQDTTQQEQGSQPQLTLSEELLQLRKQGGKEAALIKAAVDRMNPQQISKALEVIALAASTLQGTASGLDDTQIGGCASRVGRFLNGTTKDAYKLTVAAPFIPIVREAEELKTLDEKNQQDLATLWTELTRRPPANKWLIVSGIAAALILAFWIRWVSTEDKATTLVSEPFDWAVGDQQVLKNWTCLPSPCSTLKPPSGPIGIPLQAGQLPEAILYNGPMPGVRTSRIFFTVQFDSQGSSVAWILRNLGSAIGSNPENLFRLTWTNVDKFLLNGPVLKNGTDDDPFVFSLLGFSRSDGKKSVSIEGIFLADGIKYSIHSGSATDTSPQESRVFAIGPPSPSHTVGFARPKAGGVLIEAMQIERQLDWWSRLKGGSQQ